MPYTKRPKVTRNLQGEVRDEENERGKSKPRIIDDITIEYRLARDRVIWKTTKDVETIKALREKYKL